MTLEQFWNIVDRVHQASHGYMEKKCELLAEELRRMPVSEVWSFSEHFDDCNHRAYTWELWAAAYIIGHGCSDDSFSDFRATLISMGRDTFERAVANPDTLTDLDLDADNAFFEGYQYVVTEVYEEMAGDMPPGSRTHPESPSGREWDEETVAELYPRLAEKHRYTG